MSQSSLETLKLCADLLNICDSILPIAPVPLKWIDLTLKFWCQKCRFVQVFTWGPDVICRGVELDCNLSSTFFFLKACLACSCQAAVEMTQTFKSFFGTNLRGSCNYSGRSPVWVRMLIFQQAELILCYCHLQHSMLGFNRNWRYLVKVFGR